jgi:hypothetical protein
LWQERVKGLGLFCLSRDPSPFDFAQGQDDGKDEDGKTEADCSAALRNDKQKNRQLQKQIPFGDDNKKNNDKSERVG